MLSNIIFTLILASVILYIVIINYKSYKNKIAYKNRQLELKLYEDIKEEEEERKRALNSCQYSKIYSSDIPRCVKYFTVRKNLELLDYKFGKNDVEFVGKLLDKLDMLILVTTEISNLFFKAIGNNNVAMVKVFIKTHYNDCIDYKDNDRYINHAIANCDNMDMIKFLIDNGFPLTLRNVEFSLSRSKDTKYLIEKHFKNSKYKMSTAFLHAANENKTSLLRYTMSQQEMHVDNQKKAIDYALKKNHSEVIKILFDSDITYSISNEADNKKITNILFAKEYANIMDVAKDGSTEAFDFFYKHGATNFQIEETKNLAASAGHISLLKHIDKK